MTIDTGGIGSLLQPRLGPHRGPLPYDVPTSLAILDGLLRGSGATGRDVITGRRWPGSVTSNASPILLAQAPAGAIPGFSPFGPPATGNLRLPQLPGTAGGLAGAGVAAAMLRSIDDAHNRKAVDDAMQRFALDPTKPADVAAADAYVWTKRHGRYLFPRLPWTNDAVEASAQAVMGYERLHPGTKDRAVAGDFAAHESLFDLIEEGAFPEVGINEWVRHSEVDPALSSDDAIAKSKVGPQSMRDWTAHHLIPFAEMRRLPVPLQLKIVAAGWVMDSPENLIAVPANYEEFLRLPNDGLLPYHRGPHSNYSADVAAALASLVVNGLQMDSTAIRAYLSNVERLFRTLIISQKYYERIN